MAACTQAEHQDRDPEAAPTPLPLSAEERGALLASEVERLYELGVLSHVPRYQLFGLTLPLCSERMRAAEGRDEFQPA